MVPTPFLALPVKRLAAPAEPRRRALLIAAGGAAISATGCSLLPRPSLVPMPALRIAGPCAVRAPTLVVMLPGVYSLPQEFVDEGFVQALRQRQVAADSCIADAHLGYYNERSVVERLHDDIVGPARREGYRRIWLIGISLGGFGALAYGAVHGSDPTHGVDGILALAPFLGRPGLLQEIAAAPSPGAWAGGVAGAPRGALAQGGEPEAAERELWRWLIAPPAGAPPVWLGYGREDRLGEGHRLLRRALPAERAFDVPGGHGWSPWRALWQSWLDRGLIGSACAAA